MTLTKITAWVSRDDWDALDELVEKGTFMNRSDAIRSIIRDFFQKEEPKGVKT